MNDCGFWLISFSVHFIGSLIVQYFYVEDIQKGICNCDWKVSWGIIVYS